MNKKLFLLIAALLVANPSYITGENNVSTKTKSLCSTFEKISLQKEKQNIIPKITIDLYIDKYPDISFIKHDKDKIIKNVQEFYKNIVNIKIVEKELGYDIDETVLKPAERIAVAIMPRYKYVRIAYNHYTKGTQMSYNDKETLINSISFFIENIAIVHKNIICIGYNNKITKPDANQMSYIMAHEIGHCLGLFHTDEFLDDILRDNVFEKDRIVPHLMRGDYKRKPTKDNPVGAALDNASINLIKNFLNKGSIYKIYQQNDFMIHRVIDSLRIENFYNIGEE